MSRFLKRSPRLFESVRSDAGLDVNDGSAPGGLRRAWPTGARAAGVEDLHARRVARFVRMLCVAAWVALTACEESEDDLQTAVDMAEESDDGGLKALEPLQIGIACTGANECGAGGECLHVSSTSTTYPGGYCTASCMRSSDCGPGAECPVNEAVAIDPAFKPFSWWPRTCFQSCTPGASSGCRTGYECRSLAKSYGVEAKAPEPMKRTVCLPVPTWRPSANAL